LTAPVWGRYAARGNPKACYVAVEALQGLGFFVDGAWRARVPELFFARLILGAMGAASTLAFIMVGRGVESGEVRRRIATLQSSMTIGQIIGPLFGAIAAARLGIRGSFVLGGVILLGCAALVHWGVPLPPPSGEQASTSGRAVRPGEVAAVTIVVLGGSIQVFLLHVDPPARPAGLGIDAERTLEVGGVPDLHLGGCCGARRPGGAAPGRALSGAQADRTLLIVFVHFGRRPGGRRLCVALRRSPLRPGPVDRAGVSAGRLARRPARRGSAIGVINAARIGAGFIVPVVATTLLAWTSPGVVYVLLAAIGWPVCRSCARARSERGREPGRAAAGRHPPRGSRYPRRRPARRVRGVAARPLRRILHVPGAAEIRQVGRAARDRRILADHTRPRADRRSRYLGGAAAPARGRLRLPGRGRSGRTWPWASTSPSGFASSACRATRSAVVSRWCWGVCGLASVERVKPAELTLEQRRRLALARARSRWSRRSCCWTSPWRNLDPTARKALRLELTKLHRDLAVTTVHATRNAADALALSDRLAVIDNGSVLQVGDPAELYHRPRSRAVAEALGPANFLPVRVVEMRDLGVVVQTDRGDRVPVAGIGINRVGDRGLLVLRPETLSMTEAAMARGPSIPGKISLRVFEGARHLYEIDIGANAPVQVELPAIGETRMFRLGDQVRVELSTDTVILIPTT
jgi:ABC-type Fe3+/spermidine/putrescine transport system ATPase subunit/MFS family permease